MASQLQELQKKSVTSNSNGTIFYYVKYLTDLLIAPQGLLEAPVATKTSWIQNLQNIAIQSTLSYKESQNFTEINHWQRK